MRSKMVAVAVTLGFSAVLVSSGVQAETKKADKEFVGSETCKKCHAEEYKSWKETWHSKMVRTRKEGILKEVVEKWASDGTGVGPTIGNVTKAKFKLDDVKYVVGSRWKQRFLVTNDQTGGMQFLDKQFNRYTGKWENYGNANDWNTNCGTCHTTGYRILEYDEKFGKHGRTVKDTYSEMNIGCEACHGPGAKHITAKGADRKKSIFNPANADIKAQSKVCGYCHIRIENEKFMTAQGNPREDLPAPKVGDSYKAGDDWTAWYPEQAIIPGIRPSQPVNKEYAGDLKGLFKLDDHAKQNGIYEEAKHHQQYQGFLQSKHYQSGTVSCITCHSPHAGKGKLKKVQKDACIKCHDASFTVEKYMPNTGQTAGNLFMRSHTFTKNPRKGGPGVGDMGPVNYYE
jgi:predicted CXXCH cytochrome family protein